MDGLRPYEFIVFGPMDGLKPYEFIVFGTMDGLKPFKFTRFGPMDGLKHYKFTGFGPMDGLKPSKFTGFGLMGGFKASKFIGFGPMVCPSIGRHRTRWDLEAGVRRGRSDCPPRCAISGQRQGRLPQQLHRFYINKTKETYWIGLMEGL
jgi:hypothetical protein